jgi:hypothetical protein
MNFIALIFILLYVIMLVVGLLESKDPQGKFKLPSSSFWFYALVGLAVLVHLQILGHTAG